MAFTKIAAAGIGSTETVTLHSLEVLNNATVGGVLTYEDVTNVDSIGIITARAGVLVGSGITLSKDGDIFATGVTTSTTFVGDLTGNVTGNVTGNISGGTVAGSTGTFTGDVDIAEKIVHTGDTNTFIRFPAADEISLEAGGNTRVKIDSSGRLLVGGPTSDSRTTSMVLVGNSSSGSTGQAVLNMDIGTTSISDGLSIGVFRFGATGDRRGADVRAEGAGTWSAGSSHPTDLVFGTNASGQSSTPTERLRITSSGVLNVPAGIGPQLRFENQHSVTADAAISTFDDGSGTMLVLGSNFYINSVGSETRYNTSEESAGIIINRNGDINLKTGSTGATATTRLSIDTDGETQIKGDANPCLSVDRGSANNTNINLKYNGTVTGQVSVANADFQLSAVGGSTPMSFYTNGSSKMRIQADGKISIGNPASGSPNRLFYVDTGTTGDGMRIKSDEVLGDFVVNNTGDGHGRAFVINASRVDSGTLPKLHLAGQGSITLAVDSNSTRMTIDGSGNIGAPSGNNIYNASDERLKENMIDLTNGLDKINKLKPVSFTWKNGWSESLDGVTQYGFGAQTTQSVDELLVEPFSTGDVELNGETIENPLRVNEKHIIPLLVKAIQELSAKVAALEG
jgi:hypothetical protein